MKNKECIVCGKLEEGKNSVYHFCSKKCRIRYLKEKEVRDRYNQILYSPKYRSSCVDVNDNEGDLKDIEK